MAERFSAQWWNDQAASLGGLGRDDIIALSGVNIGTVWNPDGTVAVFWYKDAANRVPGFADAHLALADVSQPAGFDVHSAVGSPDYPGWAYFVSTTGYVAPGASAPYTPVYSTEAPTSFTPVVTSPTVSVIPPGWSTFGSPSWPATGPNGEELVVDVDDLPAWQSSILIPEVMLAPAPGLWIDRAGNRVVRELDIGEPVFWWLYEPPVVSGPIPSPFGPPPEEYPLPHEVPPAIWEPVPTDEDGVPLGPPTMPPQGGGPSPTTLIPEEPEPLPPPAPGVSKLLYAGAIGLGLVLLLGGRKNRS
jgi:hypothetical protein